MIGSFQTWRDLQTDKEREVVLSRFKRIVHMETVQVLRDLYFLADWEVENQIHQTFASKRPIEETRAYVQGLEFIKRLLEPVITLQE